MRNDAVVIRLAGNGPPGIGLEPMQPDPADVQSPLMRQHVDGYFGDDLAGLSVGVRDTTTMQAAFGELRLHAAHVGQPPAVVCCNSLKTEQQVQAIALTSRRTVQKLGSNSTRWLGTCDAARGNPPHRVRNSAEGGCYGLSYPGG